jgi:hypothetical protein
VRDARRVEPMEKTVGAVVLSVGLLLAFGWGVAEVAYANWIGIFVGLPSITIQSDGSVVPQTEFIKQVGNVYMLNYDMAKEYVIKINCSNIIFDGQGHCINGSMNFEYGGVWHTYNSAGMTVEGATNVTIKNITIANFTQPSIYINRSSHISILSVKVDEIRIEESNYNMISNSVTGVEIRSGSYNTVFNNALVIQDAPNNFMYQSVEVHSSNNLIYHNNINVQYTSRGNRHLIVGGDSINSWDNGSVGNYWNDYNGTDTNNDGIGDTPYVIDVNNVDSYPLMAPVDFTGPSILVLSPENKTYDEGSIPLGFTVNEAVAQITYSLDGKDNVSITGNATLSGLANGLHNVTVYAKDEFGNKGASETVSFSVDVPFPTILVIAPTVSAAVVGIGLLVYLKKRKR